MPLAVGVALLLAVTAVASGAPVAGAAPTHSDLASAKARLRSLVLQQQQLVQEYDAAAWKLQQATAALRQARAEVGRERAIAARAGAQVASAAAAAYEQGGSNLATLLGSTSVAQFTQRVEVLQAVTRRNDDAALRARVAQQRAHAAAGRLAAAVARRRQALLALSQRRRQVVASVARQRRMVASIQRQLRAAHRSALQVQNLIAPPASGSQGGGSLPPNLPPAPGPGAAAAVAAARSVLGVPYVWGGASPQTGFDCSGLSMWAWAHAGVSLPHYAAAQYAMLPKVPRDQLQPGDLVFFFGLGHVGIYIGNGMMIDAPYTGTVVRVDPVYWNGYVGAARP